MTEEAATAVHDEAGQSKRTRVFAWITLSAGMVGLLRLLPEFIQVVSPVPQVDFRYYVLVSADAVVALLGVVSGFGLLQGKDRVWPLCALFWGAGAAVACFVGWVAVPDLIQTFKRGIFIQRNWVMLPRCLYYAAMIVTAPFAFRVLLGPAPKGRPSALPMSLLLFVSAVSGAGFYAVLIYKM